jgi:ATP-dependent DNA ligase
MAWRAGDRIRLFTRHGNDWSGRYPLVFATMHGLRVRSCLIDGEIVVTRSDGVSCFERLRSRLHDETAFIYAFDLLELDGPQLWNGALLIIAGDNAMTAPTFSVRLGQPSRRLPIPGATALSTVE